MIDDWLIERARRGVPGPAEADQRGRATAQVIALKRHPAVRVVLDDFIGWKPPNDRRQDRAVADAAAPPVRRPGSARRASSRPRRARCRRARSPRRWRTPGIQFETTTEKAFAPRRRRSAGRARRPPARRRHADERRAHVRRRGRPGAVRAGAPRRDAGRRRCARLRSHRGRRGPAARADGARRDRRRARAATARSRSPAITGRRATRPRGSPGWAAARAELRRPRWAETTLAVTYRSVPAISEFARSIVDGRAGAARPSRRSIPRCGRAACAGALAQAAALCWHLDALITRDPWREICVIARTAEHARRLARRAVARPRSGRSSLDGDFRFEPGIIVTTAAAVSGLEFDVVVIPDLSPAFYPATPRARARALRRGDPRARLAVAAHPRDLVAARFSMTERARSSRYAAMTDAADGSNTGCIATSGRPASATSCSRPATASWSRCRAARTATRCSTC